MPAAYGASKQNTRTSDSNVDKTVAPIVSVVDDLKDYLSDSDLSLDYRINLQKRKKRRHH